MSKTRVTHFFEFWAVLLVPWALDIAGGRGLLTTLFGAFLWGVALILAAVRPRTQDPTFRRKQGWGLAFVASAWLMYWFLSLAEAPRRVELAPESVRWLTWLHAGLLTAGLGMVFVLALASVLWLIQDHLLRQSSWERRKLRGRLPSLESLSGFCERSVQLAFSTWGLGLFLALITAMVRWQAQQSPGATGPFAWWLDTKVVTSAVLWLTLAACFQMSLMLPRGGRWLYRSYFGLSVLFVLFFSWFMLGGESQVHGALNWFI